MAAKNVLIDTDVIKHTGGRTPLDRMTGGVVTTDARFSYIHAGKAYHFSQPIDIRSHREFLLTVDVPLTKHALLQQFIAVFEHEYSVEIWEGEATSVGDTVIPVQRNRMTNEESDLVMHDEPVTQNLKLLANMIYPATRQGGTGFIEENSAWVLKPGKSYTVRIMNLSNKNGTGHLRVDWYEEDVD